MGSRLFSCKWIFKHRDGSFKAKMNVEFSVKDLETTTKNVYMCFRFIYLRKTFGKFGMSNLKFTYTPLPLYSIFKDI